MAQRKNRFNKLRTVFVGIGVILLFVILWLSVRAVQEKQQINSHASDFSNVYVKRVGTKFYLDNREFNFVGFNLFDAAGAAGPYSCLATNGWFAKFTSPEIDSIMKQMKQEGGATVLRFWAFQKYTKGGTDFSGIDSVIKRAKENGYKVIPVLENGPGHCSEPGGGGNGSQAKWSYNNDTWYQDGYKVVNSGNTLSYRDYVAKIVERYKNEPAIFGWMMMNEADTSRRTNGSLKCEGGGQTTLVSFAKDISTLIRSIDPNHLITVGTQSNGACGGTGQDLLDVYGQSNIDFVEAHDWGYWGSDNEAIPGGVKNTDGTIGLPDPMSSECLKTYRNPGQGKIGCSFAQAIKTLKKPIVVGEVGIALKDSVTQSVRAKLVEEKMKAFFANGGAGYLYWQANHVLDSERFDVIPAASPIDPLIPAMKRYAGLSITAPYLSPSPTFTPTPIATKTPMTSPKFTPTPKATATPTPPHPTFTPTPKPTPTLTPRATATPRPTPTPTPTFKKLVVEGESMNASNKATIISDTNASEGKALRMLRSGNLVGQVQGAVKKITVRARAENCLGYPHINVKIDGKYALDQNVSATGYTDYASNSLEYMNLGVSLHSIEIIYNNDAAFVFCDRNIIIDKVTAE